MKKWFLVVISIVILIILVAIFFYTREYKNTKNKKTNNYNFIKSNENTITNNNTIINNENNIPNNNDRSVKNVKMEIKRELYLQQLIEIRQNGFIKVIKQIRLCLIYILRIKYYLC